MKLFSDEIYGPKTNLVKFKIVIMILYGYKILQNTGLSSTILKLFLYAALGTKSVTNLRMKICPKRFRAKWSFVESIPAEADVAVVVAEVGRRARKIPRRAETSGGRSGN
jgi:hypothetical protein